MIGYLAGLGNGRNVLSFAEEFTGDPGRPAFSLITHADFPRADKVLSESWARSQRLHPVLSNLLPEGSLYKNVPLNEYTAMSLAAMIGVDIPEIKLVDLDKLDNLPQINLPDESQAFAIKRFDRNDNTRIHMEDFAQILVKYPHEKYDSANYEQIGRVIYMYSGDGLADAQQLARRLLANILLANGDAHRKNWSLLYEDQVTPRLSPAYDIVTTSVYIEDERKYALNPGKTKDWYAVTTANFQSWTDRADIPWRAIKPHLDDAMDKARTLWPGAIKDLPMDEAHKEGLVRHWRNLQQDFRITAT